MQELGAATCNKPSTDNVPRRYRETTATLADLVLDEGLVVKDVISDGNCLFSAVVDQLRVRGEFFYTTASLREVAVNYLRDNPCQEDGTPLKMFLTELDGTWEQYLARMSREGEWGDHFVISALANVLQRKLIILRGFSSLTRTVTEPNKPHMSRGPGGSGSPGTQHEAIGSQGVGETRVEAGAEGRRSEMSVPDELFLGHIAEAHYVSLRHYDWEDRLHQCLSERRTPSFLMYGPTAEMNKEGTRLGKTEVGEENCIALAFPEPHLDYLMKYIRNGAIIVNYPVPSNICVEMTNTLWTVRYYGDEYSGLEAGELPGRNYVSSSATAGTASYDSENKWDQLTAESYWIPADTTVIIPLDENDNASRKYLNAVETDCTAGYTRLTPVKKALWVTTTKSFEGNIYLKHLEILFRANSRVGIDCIAFKCAWPKCSEEFLSRKRPSNWPPVHQLRMVENIGVHVVPEASLESCQPEIEWKFSFNNAECMFCRWMNTSTMYSYYFFKAVCQFLFQEKQYQFEHKYRYAVCKPQLKAVFFYTCEELPEEKFEHQPGFCLLYMLMKLQGCLKDGFLPDYFIPAVNLIADVEDKVLKWHSQQLDWFRKFVLVGIFLLFDRHDLMKYFGLVKCFETLITDVQKFVVHKKLATSYKECFLPLNILCIQNWVKIQNFFEAERIYVATFQECTTYTESLDAGQEMLRKSVDGLALHEKWLFAFYMDWQIGSHLLDVVCRGHECVPLKNVFGDANTRALCGNVFKSARVPLIIINMITNSGLSFSEAFKYILSRG